MWPDVPTIPWFEAISLVAFPIVPLSKEVVGERSELTCSRGDAQEPAGILQCSPEYLELHGARGMNRGPEGEAAQILPYLRCSRCSSQTGGCRGWLGDPWASGRSLPELALAPTA